MPISETTINLIVESLGIAKATKELNDMFGVIRTEGGKANSSFIILNGLVKDLNSAIKTLNSEKINLAPTGIKELKDASKLLDDIIAKKRKAGSSFTVQGNTTSNRQNTSSSRQNRTQRTNANQTPQSTALSVPNQNFDSEIRARGAITGRITQQSAALSVVNQRIKNEIQSRQKLTTQVDRNNSSKEQSFIIEGRFRRITDQSTKAIDKNTESRRRNENAKKRVADPARLATSRVRGRAEINPQLDRELKLRGELIRKIRDVKNARDAGMDVDQQAEATLKRLNAQLERNARIGGPKNVNNQRIVDSRLRGRAIASPQLAAEIKERGRLRREIMDVKAARKAESITIEEAEATLKRLNAQLERNARIGGPKNVNNQRIVDSRLRGRAIADTGLDLQIRKRGELRRAILDVKNARDAGLISKKKASVELKKLESQIKKNSTAWGKFTNRLDASSSRLSSIGGQLRSAGQGIQQAGRQLLFTGAAVTAAFLPAIVSAAQFEQSVTDAVAVIDVSDLSSFRLQVDTLSDSFLELGQRSEFTASQIASGAKQLGLAGFDISEVEDSIEAVTNLATVGDISTDQAAGIAANISKAFKLDASQFTDVSDILASVATNSNTTVQSIAESFKLLAPIAANLGQDFSQVSAAVGILADAGIKGCYDRETEVLTSQGWKFWDQVTGQETFATLNQETHDLEWHAAQEYIKYHYKGKMYKALNQSVDMLVTPNHNLYVSTRKKGGYNDYEIIKAEDLNTSSYTVKTTAFNPAPDVDTFTMPSVGLHKVANNFDKVTNQPEINVDMDQWLKFLGAYIAEGWYSSNGEQDKTYKVSICQLPKTKGFDKYKELLENFPIPFKFDGSSKFLANSKQLRNALAGIPDGTIDKVIPDYVFKCSARQIRIFLEYFRLGNGGKIISGGSFKMHTSSKTMADQLSQLAMMSGYRCTTLTIPPDKYKNGIIDGREVLTKHDRYVMTFSDSRLDPKVTKSEIKRYSKRKIDTGKSRSEMFEGWVDFDDEVFCVEVPNNTLFVRRGGRQYWSGNSRAGTGLSRAFSELLEKSSAFDSKLKEVGSSFANIDPRNLPITDIIAEFERLQQLGKLDTKDFFELFDERSGRVIVTLLNQGSDALQNLVDKNDDSANLAQTIKDIKLDTLNGDFKILKSTIDTLFSEVGGSLTPLLRELTVWITDTVKSTTQWVRKNKEFTAAIIEVTVKIALFASGIGGLLIVAGSIITLISTVALSLSALGVILNGLTVSVGGVAIAITGLSAALPPMWVIILAVGAAIAVATAATYAWTKSIENYNKNVLNPAIENSLARMNEQLRENKSVADDAAKSLSNVKKQANLLANLPDLQPLQADKLFNDLANSGRESELKQKLARDTISNIDKELEEKRSQIAEIRSEIGTKSIGGNATNSLGQGFGFNEREEQVVDKESFEDKRARIVNLEQDIKNLEKSRKQFDGNIEDLESSTDRLDEIFATRALTLEESVEGIIKSASKLKDLKLERDVFLTAKSSGSLTDVEQKEFDELKNRSPQDLDDASSARLGVLSSRVLSEEDNAEFSKIQDEISFMSTKLSIMNQNVRLTEDELKLNQEATAALKNLNDIQSTGTEEEIKRAEELRDVTKKRLDDHRNTQIEINDRANELSSTMDDISSNEIGLATNLEDFVKLVDETQRLKDLFGSIGENGEIINGIKIKEATRDVEILESKIKSLSVQRSEAESILNNPESTPTEIESASSVLAELDKTNRFGRNSLQEAIFAKDGDGVDEKGLVGELAELRKTQGEVLNGSLDGGIKRSSELLAAQLRVKELSEEIKGQGDEDLRSNLENQKKILELRIEELNFEREIAVARFNNKQGDGIQSQIVKEQIDAREKSGKIILKTQKDNIDAELDQLSDKREKILDDAKLEIAEKQKNIDEIIRITKKQFDQETRELEKKYSSDINQLKDFQETRKKLLQQKIEDINTKDEKPSAAVNSRQSFEDKITNNILQQAKGLKEQARALGFINRLAKARARDNEREAIKQVRRLRAEQSRLAEAKENLKLNPDSERAKQEFQRRSDNVAIFSALTNNAGDREGINFEKLQEKLFNTGPDQTSSPVSPEPATRSPNAPVGSATNLPVPPIQNGGREIKLSMNFGDVTSLDPQDFKNQISEIAEEGFRESLARALNNA